MQIPRFSADPMILSTDFFDYPSFLNSRKTGWLQSTDPLGGYKLGLALTECHWLGYGDQYFD